MSNVSLKKVKASYYFSRIQLTAEGNRSVEMCQDNRFKLDNIHTTVRVHASAHTGSTQSQAYVGFSFPPQSFIVCLVNSLNIL